MEDNVMTSDDLQEEHSIEGTEPSTPVEKEKNTISADLIRGHINTIILRTLYERDKYGYEIIDEIEEKSHGQYSLKQPTLYSALKRLESQGYIQAYWKSDEVSAGGRRKYFKLTESGKEITEKNLAEWEYSRTVIDSLISDKNFDFNNPAPSAVDFNILKKSTTRVPRIKGDEDGEDEKSEISQELINEQRELLEKNENALKELEEKKALYEQQNEAAINIIEEKRLELEREKALYEEKIAALHALEESVNLEKQALSEKQQEFDEQVSKKTQEFESEQSDKLSSLNEYEAQLNAQKKDFEEQQQKYEAMIAAQNQAIAEQKEALEMQRQIFAKQQYEAEQKAIENEKALERRLQEEQRKFTHSNFMRLVNGGTQQQGAPAAQAEAIPPHAEAIDTERLVYNLKPETERDYRNLVNKLFANTVKTNTEPFVAAQNGIYAQQPINYQGYDDATSKAANDGIKINSYNSPTKTKASDKAPYDMGFTLLKSSLIVAVILMLEFALVLLFKDSMGVNIVYPMVILAINVVQVLMSAAICFSGTLKAHKKPTSSGYVSTSIIVTIVAIFVICLVALLLDVNFSAIGDVCAKMIIPCIVALNVPIYTIGFYTFSK